MELLNKYQREQIIEQAKLLAGEDDRVAEVAQLALQLEDELEHLHHLLSKTEHYLNGGQDVSSHSHLLHDLKRYLERYDRELPRTPPPL